jgi:glycosyltransferase involved in cell wall biosynthesis
MRVLHALGWYFPDTVGGTEIYVQGLAQQLQARGHDVLVAAPRAGTTRVEEYEHDGVDVVRYPIPSQPSRAEAQGASRARGAEALSALFDRFKPDVLHVHSLVTGLGVHEMRAARDRGISVVYTNHLPSMGFACPRGTLLQWGTTVCNGYQPVETCAACALQARGLSQPLAQAVGAIPSMLTRPVRWLPGRWATAAAMTALVADGRKRQTMLAMLADRIVVLNDTARHIFVLHGARPEKVHINRLGVSGATLDRKPGPDLAPTARPIRVGFVARFDPVKGGRELAEAIRRVPRTLPFLFEFSGRADDEQSRGLREELERSLRGDARVSFGPAVAPKEVGPLLAAMDVLVCPSTWFENGPTVALEAHAVGTPVIASDFGAPREFVRDGINGRLIPPGNVDAIVDALCSIAADPAGTIDVWRRHLPPPRVMSDIVSDYERLYGELVSVAATHADPRPA